MFIVKQRSLGDRLENGSLEIGAVKKSIQDNKSHFLRKVNVILFWEDLK